MCYHNNTWTEISSADALELYNVIEIFVYDPKNHTSWKLEIDESVERAIEAVDIVGCVLFRETYNLKIKK